MEIDKDIKSEKSENGMSSTSNLPKFSQSDISDVNTSSFGLGDTDFFGMYSSSISEFMSLSLSAKIEKYISAPTFHRKLKDKNSSNTFLHYICMNDDNYPMMELIKPTIKEMDSRNNLGQTPLHISLINKNYKIAKYLIENGANVNLSDNNLDTSLHLAVKCGNVDIVRLLVKFRANPFSLNKKNETVLDLAVKLNDKECINFLQGISLMNETGNKYNIQNIQKINHSNDNLNIDNINNKNKNNNVINGNEDFQKLINNNIIFNNRRIINQNQNNPKKFTENLNLNYNYFSNNNNNTLPQKKNNYIKTIDLDDKKNSLTEKRNNAFLSKENNNSNLYRKSRPRTSSTSFLNTSRANKSYKDQIYSKKIIVRSQSGAGKGLTNYIRKKGQIRFETEIFDEKLRNINNINDNLISNNIPNNIFSPTSVNNKPRKTDFPLQNEMLLASSDNENESIEEEESIIREQSEGIKPKTIQSLKYLKTVKITPLTETKNKKNPYSQIDSYVSAIHKSDQGITESDGYINEDGLYIIEPSIDVSKIEDTINEQNQTTENENSGENLEKNKKNKNESIIKNAKDDLYTFLKTIQMEEYNDLLINEGFDDINLIISQMKTGLPINDDVLREIGITRAGDRAKILIRIQEVAKMFDFKIPFEAVYYINKKKYNLLKYDFHVKAMQNWLKKIQLQNYLENFYNNGYYSPELVFIQKASKFPINETILERDLKIENANDRKLIMNSISSNSKNYSNELQRKNSKNKNNSSKNNDNKSKEKEDNKCFIF